MFNKIKPRIKSAFWIICSATLGILLASFILPASMSLGGMVFNYVTNSKNTQTESNLPAQAVETTVAQSTKPKYFYLNNANDTPKVSATAYLVGDLNTGEVILSKNQEKQFPIASLTKLMTALVTSLIMPLDDVAQVSKTALATQGTNGELRLGEKIKTADLIYPLLLESSNDAAEVLAEHFTRDSFIEKMNQEATKLKMTSTSFVDPSGLGLKDQSSVADIFKLVGYINQQKTKQIPDLLQITTLRSFSNKQHSWSNISQFLSDENYIGGKSGYTDPAKQTVVSVFNLPLGQTGVRPIAITLLQSTDRYKDVESILNYLKKNIYYGGVADANTNWVEEKVGMPNIKDPNFVTLAFLGDIMMARGVKNSVIKNFNGDYSKLFEKLNLAKSLKTPDIVFANLEGTTSDEGADQKNLYSFRMDPEVVPAMKGAGISILSVANNHVGDWGRLAYSDTLSRLKENEILYTGGGLNTLEAETPTIIEKYGMKIGYLGFSDTGPDSMQASGDSAGILSTNNPRFDEIIKNASAKVDYLIVYFHFGDEYQTKHNARQEYLAHKAVDDGAKIIIGSHVHVVEDTEVYSRKDCTQSSCVSFIAYSLGNFIFDQAFSTDTMQGMLLNIMLGRDGGLTVRKDTVKLNGAFQPDQIIKGKEEKIKF